MSGNRRSYITTAIPYVNGDPHLGHALELVQADVLARHRRLRGDDVRFLTGTDDNALKNVDAARGRGRAGGGVRRAEGAAVRRSRRAAATVERRLHPDEHRSAAPPGRRAALGAPARPRVICTARGYEGLYCVGLRGVRPPPTNCATASARSTARAGAWSSRRTGSSGCRATQDALLDLIETGRAPDRAGAPPATRCSRSSAAASTTSASRARRSGRAAGASRCPATRRRSSTSGSTRWPTTSPRSTSAPARRAYGAGGATATSGVHVIGKGIIRFHAVYWPAILLSAGQPLPTTIFVHDYLTVEGQKICKSLGNAVDPVDVIDRYGADALRWWLARATCPGRRCRLPARPDRRPRERARRRARQPGQPDDRAPRPEPAWGDAGPGRNGRRRRSPPGAARRAALGDRRGAGRVRPAACGVGAVGGRLGGQPLRLRDPALGAGEGRAYRRRRGSGRLDAVLGVLLDACSTIARELGPFLPVAAERISVALADLDPQRGRALFPKVEAVA